MKQNFSKKGFTWMEMILTGVLIGTLTLLLIPFKCKREHSMTAYRCSGNLRQIGLGLKQYSIDNNDQFPTVTSKTISSSEIFMILTNGLYLPVCKIYTCPFDKKIAATPPLLTASNNSYSYISHHFAKDLPSNSEQFDGNLPLLFAHGPDKNGPMGSFKDWKPRFQHKDQQANFFHIDGHVEFSRSLWRNDASTNGYIHAP